MYMQENANAYLPVLLAARPESYIQPIFRDVDSNKNSARHFAVLMYRRRLAARQDRNSFLLENFAERSTEFGFVIRQNALARFNDCYPGSEPAKELT
jgi:hypothetical protein